MQPVLLLTVFLSGMATMASEMCAMRLIAPYFGDSLPVWAVLIGLIMVYLTAGYYLGGHLADKFPRESALYSLVAWAAFLIGLVPFIARPILRLSLTSFSGYNLGNFLGSLFGVVVLFSVPVILLGCVSPFAIRLIVSGVDRAGHAAGNIYAISTLGSIIGTFSPVLIFIPNIGTRRTFLVFSLLLLSCALVGLALTLGRRALPYALMPLALILLALLGPGGEIRPGAGLVYETESAYNYIYVAEENGWNLLYLNEGQGIHSAYKPGQVLTGSTWDFFLISPFFNNPPYQAGQVGSLCLVGLAAGTIAKQYTAIYGPIPIDGAEIDPEIILVGQRFFAMNEPNLNAIAQDGRYFLTHSDRKYDVIAVDAYHPPYIPFHLTTREFFTLVRDHLTEEGVVAVNVARTAWDYSLVEILAGTMGAVFPSIYVIDPFGPGDELSNVILVATRKPTKLENFKANMALIRDPYLMEVARWTVDCMSQARKYGPVFTDDLAPIEQATHRLILGYLFK